MTSTIQRFQPANHAAVSQSTAIEQSRAVAEVQAAVIVAQNVPRNIQRALAEMRESCGLMSMAQQAFYQVPNRGTGPSVHLMRELARIWGNIEHGSNELRREDEAGVSEVQAFAWDKQTNTRTSRTFIAPHERMKAGSRQRLTDLGDIQNNNNNVAARAVRECISNVLPKWFTEEAQNICRQTLEHGEGKPLAQRIDEMVTAFKGIGVGEKQIEAKLGKKRGQFDAGDVAQMGIAYTSISRGEVGRDELFPPVEAETVEDICAADEADMAKGKSKLSGKVKAVRDMDPGQGGGNAVSEGAEPSSGATPSTDSQDQENPEPPEPPGALTEATPGQTDRMAKALAKARKGGIPAAARRELAEDIDRDLHNAGCASDADKLIVIGRILEVGGEFSAADLNDGDVTKVRDALSAWRQLGTLTRMVAEALDAADMAAESQAAPEDGEQQTLDGSN